MNKRRSGGSQEAAAAAAGISVRSARRIDRGDLQPKAGQTSRGNREDPLEGVWQEHLLPALQREPSLKPVTLWRLLRRKEPDRDWSTVRRTLERRVRHWKAIHGPAPEVMFPLVYEAGEIAFCDFTKYKAGQITVQGERFDHLLFHYRLPWSGWSYVQMIRGGESFVALSEALQNAMETSGGVPKELRTDRLSAACRNRKGQFTADITRRYEALCSHYNLAYSRNNLGRAHENGRVESPHGHYKGALDEALKLRGSRDFDTIDDYITMVAMVNEQENSGKELRLAAEREHLRALPRFRFADYEIEQATVRCTSTIEIRRVVYTVPSTLIGHKVIVKLFHDHLEVLLGQQQICSRPRLHGEVERHGRAWCIQLEDVIEALRLKPRALLHCRYQRELFPDERWWAFWRQLLADGGDRDAAARLMVEALYIGCRLAPAAEVIDVLERQQRQGRLSVAGLQQRFRLPPRQPIPPQQILQHTLASYDLLLSSPPAGGGSQPADPAAAVAAGPVPLSMAEHRRAS